MLGLKSLSRGNTNSAAQVLPQSHEEKNRPNWQLKTQNPPLAPAVAAN
jgi:hypothetical protein